MDDITDCLSVCSEQKAREVGGRFDRIVSLSSPIEHTTHKHLIDDGEHNYKEFESAVQSVTEGIKNEEDVLVHCRAGISRSVSVCIAAYVENYNVTYNEAYDKCTRGFQYPDANLIDSAKKYIRENTKTEVM